MRKTHLRADTTDCAGATDAARRFTLGVTTPEDRAAIHRARHDIYARELGQHATNPAGELRDALDDAGNIYLVARLGGTLAGFVSITPPGQARYSIDKHFPRAALPFVFDDTFCETRLLTVLQPARGQETAALLMYAALRWAEAHGVEQIAAIGRREVLRLYRRVGFEPLGLTTQAGAVNYEAMRADPAAVRRRLTRFAPVLARLRARTDWRFAFPFEKPAACFHGGRFFQAVGVRCETLERRADIINADVLDAWFLPAPGVVAALREHLPWLLQTSPPADCAGLLAAISEARGVPRRCLLPGAGSSDLIFRALRHWLTPESRVLLPDPTYGEYAHVLARVIGCRVDRLALSREDGFALDPARWSAALAGGEYDLAVVVNPNSPTGRHVPREELADALRRVRDRTRMWVDETYVDYVGADESLERFAARSENVIVCKSMSKVYALSGVRAAYLCAGTHQLEALRAITPPWVVSLPAQVAAIRALADPDYYAARYAETHRLRGALAAGLRALDWEVGRNASANFLLCRVPADGGLDAAGWVAACEERGLFLRDVSGLGPGLGPRAVRVAVKDADTNTRMLGILRALSEVRDAVGVGNRAVGARGSRSASSPEGELALK